MVAVNGGVRCRRSKIGWGNALAVNPMVYDTMMASPSAVNIPSNSAFNKPGIANCRVTERRVCHCPAPSDNEASFNVDGTL